MFIACELRLLFRGSDGRKETQPEYCDLISAGPNRVGRVEPLESINMSLLSE